MTNCKERKRLLLCVLVLGFLVSVCFLGQMAIAQNNTKSEIPKDSEEDMNWLKDIAVPLAVAVIAAVIAATWSFIQAKWKGHYFQNFILRELGELKPTPEEYSEDTGGLLESYMNKDFMHRAILYSPTENKEFIFAIDNTLIYHTRQVWSGFDKNDVILFLGNLYKLKGYDKNGEIENALKKWANLVKISEDKDAINLQGEVLRDNINPRFLVLKKS